jgi:hypothetical protein
VYNYVLQNGVYLQRLLERGVNEYEKFYTINPYHGSKGGYIKKRKVSWIEYKLVYWLIYGWNDDDCNDDTFDFGHVVRLRGEGWFWVWLLKGAERKAYGNTFDLGDNIISNFHFGATTQWTWRNTAYNFRYMQWEKHKDDKNIFLIEVGSWKFGWMSDEHKGNPNNYSLVAFGWN